jgi:hypothetical protein
MSEQAPTLGIRIQPGSGITPDEAAELRELYAELPIIAEAAREALGSIGPMPTGLTFGRFMELDARIVDVVLRIEEIVAG